MMMDVENLIAQRSNARKDGNLCLANKIEAELADIGIKVLHTEFDLHGLDCECMSCDPRV